jgi:uncharacterized membrane protein YhaH (DUF805 family)
LAEKKTGTVATRRKTDTGAVAKQKATEPSGGEGAIGSFLESCSQKLAEWKKRAAKTGIEPFVIELLENYIAVLRKYVVIEGRARRKEFWMFVLANIIVVVVLAIFTAIPYLGRLFGLVSSLFGLAVMVPNFTVGVRRLHDRDKSGWFMLLVLIPLVGGIILIVMCATEGTHGSNQYGADPKGE